MTVKVDTITKKNLKECMRQKLTPKTQGVKRVQRQHDGSIVVLAFTLSQDPSMRYNQTIDSTNFGRPSKNASTELIIWLNLPQRRQSLTGDEVTDKI